MLTREIFYQKFRGVIGKKHSKDSDPKFKSNGINESKIEKNCRYFEYYIDYYDDGIHVDWVTQNNCVHHNLLDREILRCFKYLNYEGKIYVNLSDRNKKHNYKYVLDYNKYYENEYD